MFYAEAALVVIEMRRTCCVTFSGAQVLFYAKSIIKHGKV